MYKTESDLTERITDEIDWIYSMHAIKTMRRGNKIYVKGTLLKPQEAMRLEQFCKAEGYIYKGPFA